MADKARIGVRYCGGCNPRFDRVALVKRLEGMFPELEFVPAEAGKPYPAALVVCGCPARCANVSGLTVPAGGLIYLSGGEDLLPARDKLKGALQSQEARSLTHDQVMQVLPHRPPMLFIDTVERLVPGLEIRASFFAAPDLSVFGGHFPGEPVLPGVLTVEAVAQAADLLMMTTQRYAGKLPLFAGIKKANFRKKILPGSTLEIYVTLQEERAEQGIATCYGQVFVEGALAADVEVRLAFR